MKRKMRLFALLRLLPALLPFHQGALAQNLVPNPSFEEINICREYRAPCAPVGWENVAPTTLKMNYNFHTNKNGAGNQMIRLLAGSESFARNYAQTKLLCPLEKGKRYRIYAIVGTNGAYPELDFYLSDKYAYRYYGEAIANIPPTLKLSEPDIKKKFPKSIFWAMEREFTAGGNWQHLLMGVMAKRESRVSGENEYLYIDSLSIEPLEPGPLCSGAALVMDTLRIRIDRHTIPDEFFGPRDDSVHIRLHRKLKCIDIGVPGADIFTAAGRSADPVAAARVDSIIRAYEPETGQRVEVTGFFYPQDGLYNKSISVIQAERVREVLVNKYGFNKEEIDVTAAGKAPPYNPGGEDGREGRNFVKIAFCVKDTNTLPAAPLVAKPTLQPDTLIIPDVLFRFDRHELNPALFKSLDSLVAKIPRIEGTTLALIGHTDNAGEDDYNLALSQKRATSLAEYLRNKGLGDFILQVKGEGEHRPVFRNDTPEGRRRNRRVEIIIYRQ